MVPSLDSMVGQSTMAEIGYCRHHLCRARHGSQHVIIGEKTDVVKPFYKRVGVIHVPGQFIGCVRPDRPPAFCVH